MLIQPLVDPPAGGVPQLGGYREGGVPAVHHRDAALPGGDAPRQGPVGVDQIGPLPAEQLLQRLDILLVVGAVRHAVHLQHPGPRLLQRLLQQAAFWNSHPGLKPAAVGIPQIVEDHPSRAADVGIADHIQHPDHTFSPLSGSWPRRASSAPRASQAQNRSSTR